MHDYRTTSCCPSWSTASLRSLWRSGCSQWTQEEAQGSEITVTVEEGVLADCASVTSIALAMGQGVSGRRVHWQLQS